MNNYLEIIERYEKCLEKYGDSYLGVEWKSQESANKRYEIMLDIIKEKGDLLDFGCGCSGLLDYIKKNNLSINYSGLDISNKFLEISKCKYPNNNFYLCDVLKNKFSKIFDYIIMNGVFTVKDKLNQKYMFNYFKKIIKKVFVNNTKIGLAFNVMSKYVDYEKDYLFHLEINKLIKFITSLTKKFTIRHDYELWEYTVYLYK